MNKFRKRNKRKNKKQYTMTVDALQQSTNNLKQDKQELSNLLDINMGKLDQPGVYSNIKSRNLVELYSDIETARYELQLQRKYLNNLQLDYVRLLDDLYPHGFTYNVCNKQIISEYNIPYGRYTVDQLKAFIPEDDFNDKFKPYQLLTYVDDKGNESYLTLLYKTNKGGLPAWCGFYNNKHTITVIETKRFNNKNWRI